MAEIVLFGEPMAMFVADSVGPLDKVNKFTRSLAGSEVNVAIGLRRLGHSVLYVSRLGNDPFGKYIENCLQNEGIEIRCTYDTEHATGFQLKSKVNSGDPEVYYFRSNSAATYLTGRDVDSTDFSGTRFLHLTGIFPALSQSCRNAAYRLIERAHENAIPISFDPNLRPGLWKSSKVMVSILNDMISRCDFVLPGIEEGEILTGCKDPKGIAEYYLSRGVKMVTVKLGSHGSYTQTKDKSFFQSCVGVNKIVDTVGAGDGFAVGIISGILEGLDLYQAVKRGNAIGALQLMVRGDNEGLPTREKLEDFMRSSRDGTTAGD